MSGEHLIGWRLSAGDEHVVLDGSNRRLVSVPCGGMSGRTFAEAADCARLIARGPELLALAYQYRSDLRYPPTADSIGRRLISIEVVLSKMEAK